MARELMRERTWVQSRDATLHAVTPQTIREMTRTCSTGASLRVEGPLEEALNPSAWALELRIADHPPDLPRGVRPHR